MIKANGIHHIAIMAADIREHIAFFSDVMGFQLSALFDMHGVPGGVHAFLHMDDHSYFSVVQLPAVKDIPIQLGVTHAGTGAGPSAPGTMQHLAFRVDTLDDLLAIREDGRPGMVVHDVCPHLIEQLSSLPTDDTHPEDVDTEAEDHAYDCLRYGTTRIKTMHTQPDAQKERKQKRLRSELDEIYSRL
jgi:catechol 2,3-dioxygenase-like lactoylglutathione lyase family enzyme